MVQKNGSGENTAPLAVRFLDTFVIIIIFYFFKYWPFSSTDFQGPPSHNIDYEINIQYLRSNKENLERS